MYDSKVNKAIADVLKSAELTNNMRDKVWLLETSLITVDEFWVAYNQFRSKRGELMNED